MSPKVKKLWIEALKSGEFKQGVTYLQKDGCFCVVGVLCELFRRETGRGEWRYSEENGVFYFKVGEDCFGSAAPSEVSRWAQVPVGLWTTNVKGDFGREMELWELNDSLGYDFLQLANVIEECF